MAAALAAVALVLSASPAQAGYPRPWADNWDPNFGTPALNLNIRGNILAAGNTLLVCPAGQSGCGGDDNNGQRMRYVDVDGPGAQPLTAGGTVSTFNSSQATLTLPVGRASIVKAYLYWGADLSAGVERGVQGNTGAPDPSAARQVLLSLDGGGYARVNATKWAGVSSWYSTRPPGTENDWPTTCVDSVSKCGFAYQARADVTSLLTGELTRRLTARKAAGGSLRAALNLDARVANLQAGIGNNRYGGWALNVVYDDPSEPFRNVTAWDGYRFVQVEGGELKVVGPLQLSGFKTRGTGDPDAHVGLWAYEGDRGITGDFTTLGRAGVQCPVLQNDNVVFDPKDQKYLADAVNPQTNFFNSTISRNGAYVTTKNPNVDNQLGFDLDQIKDNTGFIANGVTGATLCLGSRGDTYFLGGVTFNTLIDAPNAQILKTDAPGDGKPVFSGDTVEYTVTVSNPPTADNANPETVRTVKATDALPPGADFVAFTQNPGGKCALDARTITCEGIQLAKGDSFVFKFKVLVTAAGGSTLSNRASFIGTYGDNNYPVSGTSPLITNPVYGIGVAKTAATAFTRTYAWDIAKRGTPSAGLDQLAPGASGSITYDVVVTNTSRTDSGFAVSGTITVTNPAPIAARIASVTDLPEGAGPANVSCPGGLPATVPAGGSLVCTYEKSVLAPISGTNAATATLINRDWGANADLGTTRSSATASFAFGAPTTEVNKTVRVVDALNGVDTVLGDVTAPNDLGPDGTKTFTFTQPVGPLAPCTSTAFVNRARAVSVNGQLVVLAAGPTPPVIIGAAGACPAAVTIVKQTAASPVPVGGAVRFDLTVTNVGPGAASGVVVTDPVPPLVAVTSVTPSQGTCTQAQSFSCALGALAPGASATITVLGTAGVVGEVTTVPNTATVTWTPPIGPPGTGDGTDRVTIPPSWDMRVVKSASPASVAVGGDLTYTLDVANAGPSPVANGTLSDTVPAGLTLKTATVSAGPGTCTTSGSAVNCGFGPMAAGETRQVRVTATTTAAAVPLVTNTAVAGPTACPAPAEQFTCDVDPGNNTSTVTTPVTPVADLRIAKVGDATVAAGADINYELRVTNDGPSDATGVLVIDTLPAGTGNPQATTSQGTCAVAGSTLTCQLGGLAVGRTAVIDVRVTTAAGQAGQSLKNSARVSGREPDPDQGNNASGATTGVATPTIQSAEVTPGTVVSLQKHASAASARPGDRVVFSLLWRNTGPATARQVRICDRLPAGMTFLSAPGATYRGGQACWSRASARTGLQLRATVNARVDAETPSPTLTDTVTATAANAPTKRARATVKVSAVAAATSPPRTPPPVTG